MKTLQEIGIDPTSHAFISSDILLAGKLTLLMEWAREMEEQWNLEHPSHSSSAAEEKPFFTKGVPLSGLALKSDLIDSGFVNQW